MFNMATITAIKQQKRNPQRVSIYLDGVYAFPLAKIVAVWLKVGQELSPEKVNQLQVADEAEKAYQRALNFISYRPRCRSEVERNLRSHEISPALIEQTLERLSKAGFIDDAKFAQLWVEDRSTFRPRSAFALRAELRQKGLPMEIIEAALQGLDEPQLALEAARRKARQLQNLSWQEFRSKVCGFLTRRGFGYEIARETCHKVWDEIHTPQLFNSIETSRKQHG